MKAHANGDLLFAVPHTPSVINAGSGTVFVNGKAIARIGDKSCDAGAITTGGSSNVFAGWK